MIPLDHPPLPCTTREGRRLAEFLIDSRRNETRGLVRDLTIEHLELCDGCPIKDGDDGCWADNASEDWVKRLKVEERNRAEVAA